MRPSKLTNEQKEQLKQDFASGEYTRKQLSIKYGISYVHTLRLIGGKEKAKPKTKYRDDKSSAIFQIRAKLKDLKEQREVFDAQISEWTVALKALEKPIQSGENINDTES